MPKKDEIRSSEKLLELIRTSDHEDAPANSMFSPAESGKKKNPAILRPLSFPKKFTVGIDIGHTYIKMARVQRLGEKNFEMVDYLDVPLDRNFSVSDPEILKLLKEKLHEFCGNPAGQNIWCAITSAKVETRCIRIPKLARKQIPNAVFWTFTKKISYSAIEEILDYEVLGDITEGGIKKTEVMAFKAPKEDVKLLKDAFQSIGYPLQGITIVPFAIQNLFRAGIIPQYDHDICCLFVGRDWSRIAIFNNDNLVLSRGIKAGIRSMVEAINLAIQRKDGWDEPHQPEGNPNKHSLDEPSTYIDPVAQKLFLDFIRSNTNSEQAVASSGQPGYRKIFQWIQPAMERLIRQVERTIEHYALNFHREGVRRIFISGRITANPSMINYIGQQLNLPIAVMNPFSADSFARRVRIPDDSSEKEAYMPAIGLALSSNSVTPNFLYTHQDKDAAENVRRNNMRILTLCLLCLMVLIGIFSWQERLLDEKRTQLDNLNQKLSIYNPPADKNLLLALYAKTKYKQKSLQSIVYRYAPLTVVQELSQITPSHIRLLNIDAKFAENNAASASTEPGSVSVEGLIFGNPSGFENELSTYLFILSNSPIFRKPGVLRKRVEYFDTQEVFRFSAKFDMMNGISN